MKRKHKRLTFVIIAMALLGIAVGLVLMAFEENIVFFNSPTDIATTQPGPDKRLRLGGLVEEGSVVREAGSTVTRFRVTDLENVVDVVFDGILPDLFREGQGVIAEGKYINGAFQASEVLAKHDEQYMPPEVADALKKSGQWKGDETMKTQPQENK
ncbi:MAG: cytochrome c maturation protein CcmE [Rhodospirillaceae bacterium]|nr:cytochrome c maturation protein CcmE [Rhodospirillaceae bacterium]